MNPEKHRAFMAGSPRISIVIPAYNEAGRLPDTLARLTEFLRTGGETWEVIVVVEESSDGTLELAKRAAAEQGNFRVLANERRHGKGFSVRRGMLAATGDLIFFMDADLSVPVDDIAAFVKYADGHPEADVLVANRHHPQSQIEIYQGPFRQLLGHVFSFIVRAIAPVKIRDTQCGFKAFRRAAARAVFARQQIAGFAFDVEALLRAHRLGLVVRDLPVRWKNSKTSSVYPIRDGLRMLLDVLKMRWRMTFGEAGAPVTETSVSEPKATGEP